MSMQYTQLKHIVEIDSKITHLHKELSRLYAARALFVGNSDLSVLFHVSDAPNNNQAISDPWITQTYAYLTSAWMVHGISLPPLLALEKKLYKARKVIEQLAISEPDIAAEMTVVLVPPSNLVPFPALKVLRRAQPHVSLGDYANPSLLEGGQKTKKSWQLLVAYSGNTGLDFGSAAHITKNNKYVVGGYDSRALGLRQYVALSLQINQAIDQNMWTLLLGEKLNNNGLVPSVTFLNGQYRFELDESTSILGEERFRPAVEITG